MKTLQHGAARALAVLAGVAMLAFVVHGDSFGKTPKSERTKVSGWIGVMIDDVSERIAHKNKLESEEGAFVREVVPDSPADSAGIQEGDVIVAFNDKKIEDPGDLVDAIRKTEPGTKATLAILRTGEKKNLTLVVGKTKKRVLSHFFRMPPIPQVRVSVNSHVLGLELMNLNEQLGEYFGAANNEGVLVAEVKKGSTGDKAGFKAGDVIIRAGKRTVEEIDDVRRELRRREDGEKVEFEVLRKGTRKTLSVEVEESDDSGWNGFPHKPDPPGDTMYGFPFDDADLQFLPGIIEGQADHFERRIEKLERGKCGFGRTLPECITGRAQRTI